MKPNRITKHGKLDICTELIGGASDGMLCDYEQDIIRILKKKDFVPFVFLKVSQPDEFIVGPDFQYDEYVRISTEKAILRE